MMLRRILQATVFSTFAFASVGLASSQSQPPAQQGPKTNVLVVKTPVDKTTGLPQQQGSQLQGVNVLLQFDSQGKVDTQKLAHDAKVALASAPSALITPNQYDATKVPAKVKARFTQADHQGSAEQLYWTWYYYYPSYDYGWYGYGYYPYTYYYSSFYPYYGYYDSLYDSLYDYNYGYYDYDGGYYYTYYYYNY